MAVRDCIGALGVDFQEVSKEHRSKNDPLLPAQAAPYEIRVHFDANEDQAIEQAMFPGGIVGFSLDYTMVSC